MPKVKLGAKTFLYPMPIVLVGAVAGGRENFAAVAYCGIMNHDPAIIAVSLNKSHYSNAGIKEHGCFSVNMPTAGMMSAVDYCGLFSGARVDKSGLFGVFYGKLKKAPMIEECSVNLECELIQTLQFSVDEVFIGKIVQAYSEKKYLTGGLPDVKKMDPAVFSMHDNNYWKIGAHIGKAWAMGEQFRPKSKRGTK